MLPRRLLALLIPAYLTLLAPVPRQAVADTYELTCPATLSGGIVTAYTTGWAGESIPGAWLFVNLVPNGGLASMDGSRYGHGFVLHGDPGQRLTGTVDQFGFLGLPASRPLAGCWTFDGSTVTLRFGDTNPCPLADWNLDGRVSVQDIFDFVSTYLSTPMPEADLYSFIGAWFGS